MGRERLRLVFVCACLAAVVVTPAADARHALSGSAHFRSPSGNIQCFLQDGRLSPPFVDCLVAKNTWRTQPSRPPSCDVDFFPAEVALGAKGRVSVGSCRGDVGPACIPKSFGCRSLAYGRAITSRHFRCASAVTGITCFVRHRSRRLGFRVARAGYAVFR
jgi:hypothetical protein